MTRLLIKNAILPDKSCSDILIADGTIVSVRPHIEDCGGEHEVLDVSGLHVMPSFVDMHTHLRTPGQTHKETIATGCAAAVRGGYTALVAMANTTPVCSDISQAERIASDVRELGLCDVYQCLSLTRGFDGKTISHIQPSDTVRCVSEDGRGVADGAVFIEALRRANACGLLPLIHAEDASLSAVDMTAAEDVETLRDLYLIKKYGLRAHFCHVSTEASARAIIDAKSDGAAVSLEVSPHHLALSDSTHFRVNPPLRPESDRAFVMEAVVSGTADVIATDHAPHTTQDKLNGSPGLVGLETAFGVCYTKLCKERGATLEHLSRMLGANPRRLLGLQEVRVAPSFPADLAIANLNDSYIVDSTKFKSLGRNTPFEGMRLWGKIMYTIKDGIIVYKEK